MVSASRRKLAGFFLIFGICLVALAVALNVGWIFLSLEQIALLVFGIVFFTLIITGLILNTIFLFREIRRNEQHDAFINAVTHELKTPIASMRLYLETLKTREVTEEKRREFYDVMLKDSDRLLNTVELVLQAGRTRDRTRKLNIATLNLNGILADSIERIRLRYDLPEDEIEIKSTENFELKGDSEEIQSVFMNLIDNAVKYSNQSKVDIAVKKTDRKVIEIRIKDSGVGIPPSELKRIFRRFYRVPSRLTQKTKGTGLGLFIVKSIVKKHGGKIRAESEGEGKGSTFIVELPPAEAAKI
jgi:two-component system, OmpR family, sensor histidine kinase SenX3